MVENLSIKKLTMYSIVLVLAILFIVIGYMICGKEISKYNTEKFVCQPFGKCLRDFFDLLRDFYTFSQE